jgi:hypothetical protein
MYVDSFFVVQEGHSFQTKSYIYVRLEAKSIKKTKHRFELLPQACATQKELGHAFFKANMRIFKFANKAKITAEIVRV